MSSDPLFKLDAEIAKLQGVVTGTQQRLKGLLDARAIMGGPAPSFLARSGTRPRGKGPELVLEFLEKCPSKTATRKDIENALGGSAKVWIAKMVKDGTLLKVDHGIYKSPLDDAEPNGSDKAEAP